MSKRRWLIAILEAVDEAEPILPWTRGPGRAGRKAALRARLRAG